MIVHFSFWDGGSTILVQQNYLPEQNLSTYVFLDEGYYTYNGVVYRASSLPSGAKLWGCRLYIMKALNTKAPCEHKSCTFDGVWNGGGGAGQKNLYVASFFFAMAKEYGMIDSNATFSVVRPVDYENAALKTCRTKYKDVGIKYPNVRESNKPFICLDLVYLYSILVDGFRLSPYTKITLVNKIKYRNSQFEAAWPLGSAIEAVSRSEGLALQHDAYVFPVYDA